MAEDTSSTPTPEMSVLIPASNEEAHIGACLDAIARSEWSRPNPVEVLVIANGCRDQTAQVARRRAPDFEQRGWSLVVVERTEGGKLAALNAGDALARGASRVYVDADVMVSPRLLEQLAVVLEDDRPRYASGTLEIVAPDDWFSKAYARIYRQVPFMSHGTPGCGIFAVNAAGRRRWGEFPDIIADDLYVRLLFTPEERVSVEASYQWPVVEGLENLIRVRRRQQNGTAQVHALFPELSENEDQPRWSLRKLASTAFRDPLGFAVYAGVVGAVRLRVDARSSTWSRGR